MNSVIPLCKVFMCLLFVFILSCKSQNAKPNSAEISEKDKQSDTATNQKVTQQEKYIPCGDFDFRLTDDTLNFEKVLIKQLTEQPNKSKFVIDSLLAEGYSGAWYFWQGHVFSKKREHALIFINGTGLPIFIFEKKKQGWQSVIRIEYPKPLVDAEKTIELRDLNYDGTVDLGINHGDFGGHYSCSSCYRVYLYDDNKNTFHHKDEFDNYLDVQFDTIEKSVYVGKHGYSTSYFKCDWKGFNLVKKEEVSFSESDSRGGVIYNDENEYSCTRKHFIIEKGKKTLIDKAKTCHLPLKWEKIFDFDHN